MQKASGWLQTSQIFIIAVIDLLLREEVKIFSEKIDLGINMSKSFFKIRKIISTCRENTEKLQ